MKKKYWLLYACFTISLVVIQACGTGNISREFTKKEAVRLLASDASKQWNMVSRSENGNTLALSECEAEFSLHFTVTASDSLVYRIDNIPSCNSGNNLADTLLSANWSLSQNVNLISTDTLHLTKLDNTSLSPIGISVLTARKLKIQFLDEDSNLVIEDFVY